jgi:hypothetical protein
MKIKLKDIEKIIVKILLTITVIIISIVLIGYFILWGYIGKFNKKESVDNYKERISYSLTEDQSKIIWFTLTNNKDYQFKWYPFIVDGFFKSDDLTLCTVNYLVDKNETYHAWPFISYATSRYINKKIKWNERVEIIASCAYFYNGIYGIKNASNYYYSKDLNELDEKEIISLALLIRGAHYMIGTNRNNDETIKVYMNYHEK